MTPSGSWRSGPIWRSNCCAAGAPEMWNLLDEHINEKTVGKLVHRLIDFYHLTEKLGKAAQVMLPDGKQSKQLLGRWKLQLLNRSQAS